MRLCLGWILMAARLDEVRSGHSHRGSWCVLVGWSEGLAIVAGFPVAPCRIG
jgi:hypothetical protein